MGNKTHEGGCVCGAIRYRVRGAPENSMVCHCRTCRRVSGAPVLAWLTFAQEHFELLQGEPVEFSTSAPVLRTFCGRCGTPLTYENAKYPDTVDVATCTLDEPGAFPPTHHSWLSHDVPWVKFGDGLPSFEQSRLAGS